MARQLTCKYCERSFIQPTGGTARYSCYRPECERKHRKYMDDVKNKACKRWQNEQKAKQVVNKRLCSICGKPLPLNRHYYHEYCLSSLESRGVMPRLGDEYKFVWA